MARMSERELTEVTRNAVAWYAGVSDHAKAYLFEDHARQAYVVTGIENEPGSNHSWVMVQAHVSDECVIIDEDTVWEKNLWRRLEDAGVPREQIIRAYLGEKLPEASGA